MKTILFLVLIGSMALVGCGQSDPGITTSVASQLAGDDLVKARRIDVDTRNSVVTLSGEVGSVQERDRALEIARNTEGVVNVVDQLAIVPEAAPTTGTEPDAPVTGDAGITAEVKAKLLADPDTSGLAVDVDTSGGVVTLSGTVESQAEKAEAMQIAREVSGVTNIVDRLTVEPRPQP